MGREIHLIKSHRSETKISRKNVLGGPPLALQKLYQHMTLAVQQANRQFVTLTLRELLFGQNMTAEKRKQEEALTFRFKRKTRAQCFQLSEEQRWCN